MLFATNLQRVIKPFQRIVTAVRSNKPYSRDFHRLTLLVINRHLDVDI
jgi:hypothetical protein